MQATDNGRMVVAIDGPSGSGKSTVARGVATRLGFGYLDTGAMYRAATWLVLDAGLPLAGLADESQRVAELLSKSTPTISTDPADRRVGIAGHDVTEVIRGEAVTSAVSVVAALPVVRAALAAQQRSLAAQATADRGGIVVEGRDIGTVIFPDARLKMWLTASPEARGMRRAAEHSDSPAPVQVAVETVVEQLARRDQLDSTRPLSPLHCAPDAHFLDTTPLSADQVIDAVLALWNTIELPDAGTTPPRHDSATGAVR